MDRQPVEREVADAIAIARRLRPPMKRFAYEMRRELALSETLRQVG